jgi:gliding motility-associated-like protein
MSGYGCELGIAIIPPLNCSGSDEVSFSRNNNQQFLLNILCLATDVANFELNGNPALVPPASFAPVPGTGGVWMGAQIDYSLAQIPAGSSNLITNSSGLFALGVINGGATTGCLYHYMSSFLRRVKTEAGSDVTVCNGEPQINLNGSVSGGTTTGIWTVLNGTGTLNTPTNLSTTYIPSASDYAQGTLTFVLSSTGNCDPKTDTMIVTFIQSPVVEAGENQSFCKNNIGAIPISGLVSFAAGASWSGGVGGAFANPGALSTTYTPSPSDLANDSVVLYFTSSGSLFACPDDEDSLIVFFTEPPVVTAGANLVLCSSQNTINLNGSVSGATTSGVWTTTGGGAFSPSNNVTNGQYNVSSADTTAGTIFLTLTSTNNGNCLAEQDQIQVTFLAPPTVSILSNDSICSNLTFIDLDGFVSGGFSSTWTTTGFGSITAPNNIPTQYTITPVDTAVGFVDVFLATDAGICPVEMDLLRIYFIDPPFVFAGPDDESCDNAAIQLNGSISGFSTNGTWTSFGTGSFIGGSNVLSTIYSPSPADIANGSVTLMLSSESVFGCPAVTDNITFTFKEAPAANFSSTTACAGTNTVFTDLSSTGTGSITNWDWDFGDLSGSITSDPSHPYSTSGTFNATLIVTSSNGCFDTITLPVNVNPVPVANFSPTAGCENMPITFSDLSFISSGTINQWLYDFGSTTSNVPNPVYIYNGSGTQSVNLTVTSALGCVDDTTMSILVNPAPIANFTYSPNPALVGENVYFNDASSGVGVNQWYWEFGDGEANNASNPIHNYDNGGEFEILLAIEDANGCTDTIVKNIVIALPPVLPSGFTPNGDGENDVFIIRGGPFDAVDFKVYNNWGEVIFSTTDANEGWNGDYLGEPSPVGVYTWTFVVTLANGVIVKGSGDVTLIR